MLKLFERMERYLVDDEYKLVVTDRQIRVINYVEIVDFSSEKIEVRYKGGVMVVKGQGMVMAKMLEDELLVTGKFMSIEYN